MPMGIYLGQRLEQKLKMTSQMIQSIELLQLPLQILEQRINQELMENPLLELDQEAPEEESEEGAPEGAAAAEPEDAAVTDAAVEPAPGELSDAGVADAEAAAAAAEEPPGPAELSEAGDFERLSEIAEDDAWEDLLTSSPRSTRGGDEDPKLGALQNTAAPPETLQEHLADQLAFLEAPPRLKELAREIIYNLDENGYLRYGLEQIFAPPAEAGSVGAAVLPATPLVASASAPTAPAAPVAGGFREGLSPEEAAAALELVQNLEPVGVGARSVEECLTLQLQLQPENTEFEERLIREHLDDLLNNRLPKVARALGVSLERVKAALAVIGRLNPHPGTEYARGPAQPIVPDVLVEEVSGEFVVRMNDAYVPRLRISPAYREMLRQERRGSPTRDYLRQKFQSAKWLVGALEQRRSTLYRIAVEIVALQREFLERGPKALRPLMMQEVADRIGMHVSTVSRAIAEKWMQTPQGLFPLRSFFSGGYTRLRAAAAPAAPGAYAPAPSAGSAGFAASAAVPPGAPGAAAGEELGADGAVSSRTVMLTIQELIRGEDRRHPLSDQELVEKLRARGLEIARRTVAKYREKLNLPSSRQRREY